MSDDRKIIFSMVGVSKIYPPHKQVGRDHAEGTYEGPHPECDLLEAEVPEEVQYPVGSRCDVYDEGRVVNRSAWRIVGVEVIGFSINEGITHYALIQVVHC